MATNYVNGFNLFTHHALRKQNLRKKRVILGVRCERKNNVYVDDGKKKKPRILVAGGGIGGLVFALAAKRKGFDVKVFEKDITAARGEGRDRGPIQLLSSALGLLQSIDGNVAAQIMESGYVTGDRSHGLADGKTGEWLMILDFETAAVEKGIPVTHVICRVELQRILLDAIGDETVVNNSKVVDFVDDPDKVTMILENGEKYDGDILIGADGIHSMVRSKLFGGRGPEYSNFICYTGVVQFHPHDVPRFGYKIFVGNNQYLVAAYIGKERMQWYAFVREACCQSVVPSTENKKLVVELFGDWCDEISRLINQTPDEMIIRRPIHDIDMSDTWGRGRVVLLGDAAHAMLPNLGQGGSMAIEDCYWLMLELQNFAKKHPSFEIPLHEVELAFKRFEKKRMFRIRTLHSVCRVTSVMTSLYQTYLDIGPFPFFNLPSIKLKHPSFLISSTLLQLVVPKFMDWVIVGQE